MVRVRAGISYALTETMDEGHCGLPTDELVLLAEKLLEVPGRPTSRGVHHCRTAHAPCERQLAVWLSTDSTKICASA